MKHLTTIPFSGFYCTLHETAIDDSINRMFSDRDTGCHENEGLSARVYNSCDFRKVHHAYAREYCVNFSNWLELGLEFDSMDSPREYNFTTDRLFAYIETDKLNWVFETCDKMALSKLVSDKFTSRDGFISHYSADLQNWGAVETWDHNQIGALLECIAQTEHGDFDQYAEYELMSPDFENGGPENWISEATPNIDRLYRVFDYLETRSVRA